MTSWRHVLCVLRGWPLRPQRVAHLPVVPALLPALLAIGARPASWGLGGAPRQHMFVLPLARSLGAFGWPLPVFSGPAPICIPIVILFIRISAAACVL